MSKVHGRYGKWTTNLVLFRLKICNKKKKRIMSINIPNNRLKKQKRDRKRESKQA